MSIKFENTEVVGWKAAIRGMRNPMNSWEKSDSGCCPNNGIDCSGCPACNSIGKCTAELVDDIDNICFIGSNDHKLMMSLAKGGPVHAKYRRMIVVYVDITAPLYWWKEFDTYKVGTVANSCSTMHKIHEKEFTLHDFSCEHLLSPDDFFDYDERTDIAKDNALATVNIDGDWCYFTPKGYIQMTCNILNHYREKFLETKNKKYWWQIIQLLPSSYNQKRTVMLNYEVLTNIYKSRINHKLDEWSFKPKFTDHNPNTAISFIEWIEALPYSELITLPKNSTDK